MTDKERQTFARLEQVYRRALDELERMPTTFVVTPGADLSFTPTPERERLWQKAIRASRLFDNYRAMVEGSGSLWWHIRIPRGWQLYLTGKAKPSLTLGNDR